MADPSKPAGMGLYADLLADPQKKSVSGSTISSAPVRYNLKAAEPVETAAAPKKKDASLQFQPNIKRPQPKAKPRPHPGFSASLNATVTAPVPATEAVFSAQAKDINFWLEQGNDHNYVRPKPKWHKDKKNKKRRREESETYAPDWDEIYDPTQPNIYRAYKGSEEQYREIAEWKDRLYFRAHESGRGRSQEERTYNANPMFAPPVATPSLNDATNADITSAHTEDATGEDAFARRARLTLGNSITARSSSPVPAPPDLAPVSATSDPATDYDAIKAAAQDRAALIKAKIDALKPRSQNVNDPEPQSGLGLSSAMLDESNSNTTGITDPSGTISRAPIRYAVPETSLEVQQASTTIPDEPVRSKKPGFGQRMLEKQGWKKGQGLGAESQGITTAISVQAEKRKKRADADGGGYQGPRNMGKIVGGKKQKTNEDAAPGMSTVVKLPGMLQGLDVKHEIEQKNLQQELGEWFNENYGTVERVHIWRQDQGGNDEVFIKFTNAISALKAVNPVDVLTFANNEVKAQFFDAARFDNGDYADS